MTNQERAANILKNFQPDIVKGGPGSGKHKLFTTHKESKQKRIQNFSSKKDKQRWQRNNYSTHHFKEEHELTEEQKQEYK